ncbi:hypothetical protein EI94DRAFT_1813767 [Lactarius quietus]|nr:hypothetical protein EI94DRAFT_1813767 [Lactarius quietus]
MAMGTTMDIALFVQNQLSSYNYTFLKSPKTIRNGKLIMQSKPYCNDRIIAVICDVYFTSNGGKSPFATWYKYLFQQTEDDGETTYEVPIPMVALVAMALYAILHVWCTGNQEVMEFSTNTYLDVYQGHINTL